MIFRFRLWLVQKLHNLADFIDPVKHMAPPWDEWSMGCWDDECECGCNN